MRLGIGDYYGKPFRMTQFEKRWTYRLFEYWPEEGEDELGRHHYANQLRYKRATFLTAKGNGKTPFEGAIAAEGLCGPTAPVSPLVLVAASALVQSNLVFGDFKSGITHEDSPLAKFVVPLQLAVQLKDAPGEVKRVAAAEGSNDGPRATKLLADELHEWTGATEAVFTVLEGAIGKRLNCQTIGISTAGVDLQSLLGKMYTKGKRISRGEIVDDEILFECYEVPETVEIPEVIRNKDDLEQWRLAIRYANPAIEDGGYLHEDYIRARFDGAQEMPRYKWLRYHADRWTKAEKMWLPAGKWAEAERLEDETDPDKKGAPIVLAFSGTYDRESAGLVAIFEKTNTVKVMANWEDPENDEYEVPTHEVKARVTQIMQNYTVRRFMCNPNGWHGEIQEWTGEWGDRKVIEFDWMHQIKRKHDACSKFFTSVVTRELDHTESAALTRHLESATLKETSEGAWITRISREGPSIALAQAAVIGWDQVAAQVKVKKGTLVTF